ncbi:unnamed protein product [Rhodiola kirilowii]
MFEPFNNLAAAHLTLALSAAHLTLALSALSRRPMHSSTASQLLFIPSPSTAQSSMGKEKLF